MNAAKILAKRLGNEASPYLGPLILSKEFEKREIEEKKAFVEALGQSGAPDSVRILEEILDRRAWKQMKSHVEAVLASMDLNEAKVALARWKRGRRRWPLRF